MNIDKVLDTVETLCISHGKLEAIIESSMNGIVEVNNTGEIISYNPSFLKMFSLSSRNIKKFNINNILTLDGGKDLSHYFNSNNDVVVHGIKTLILNEEKIPFEKYYEYKFLSIPCRDNKSQIIIITDKSEVMKALKNRELYITSLFNIISDLKVDNRNTIYHLAKLVELRDSDTGRHLERVEEYTRLLATEYQRRNLKYDERLTDDFIEDMALSSVLHDIGKIGISDIILNKKGKLTEDEYEAIKQHTIIAGEALMEHKGKKDFLAMGREISFTHHEKWDGSGYPCGLKGEEIPLCGRIVTIGDVYDALVSERPYKEPFPHKEAVGIIIRESGKSFDPEIVECFLNIHPKFDEIRKTYI